MHTNGVGGLLRLAVETLRSPKRSLRIVLDIVITMPELLQITALIVVLGMILPIISLMFQPEDVQQAMSAFSANPIPVFFLQLGIILSSAGLITFIGKIFQGHGTFKEALTAMVWLQFILIGVQFLQVVFGILSPQLNALIFLFSVMIMFYLIVNFIMEIHGFKNALAVVFGVFGTCFGFALILSILLLLLGFTPEAIQNV